jgi:uncharacterized protein (TIGR02594 family)
MSEQYKCTAWVLNLREGPSRYSTPIGFLVKDEIVTLLDKSPDLYWYQVQTTENQVGWASHKFLVLITLAEDSEEPAYPVEPNDPPWLEIAIQEIGTKEIPGATHNPRIVEYHRSTTLNPAYASRDETHWCSSFVNWCVEKANYEGTDSALARSWLKWGKKQEVPRRGCVTVFSRPGSAYAGHVGFYIGETPTRIKLLGGNQNDEVNISYYQKNRLLGFRWSGID